MKAIWNGQHYKDAAWFYPQVYAIADKIIGYIALWHGVEITE